MTQSQKASAESPEKTEPVKEAVGCGCLILFAGYLIWPIFWTGRPASFLSIGLFLVWWITHLAAKRLKQPEPTAKVSERKPVFHIATGLLATTSQAILWTGTGLALVWALQLIFHVFPERIGPDDAVQIQIAAYDLSHRLKSDFTPFRFLVLIIGALALSTAIGSPWPINVAGKAKKSVGIAAAVLIAFSAMTFATVQTGSSRFDASVDEIRAVMGADLERLRQARQEKAALQWIGASLQQTKQSPKDAAVWRSYLLDAGAHCDAAESEFADGYQSYAEAPPVRHSSYCSKNNYLAELSKRQLQAQPLAKSGGEFWLWLPEFGRLRTSDTSHLPKVGSPAHFVALQGLAKRIRQAANDEQSARDQVESSVTAMMATILPDNASDAAGQVLDALKGAVLAAVYRDGRDKIAMWLQLRNTPLPRPVSVVLGIEPGIKLVPPSHVIADSAETNAFGDWIFRHNQRSSQSIRELGRNAAKQDRQYEIQEQQEQRQRQAEDLERARVSRAEVERVR